MAYRSVRTITTLDGLCQLLLTIRRCHNPICERYHFPIILRRKGVGHYRMESLGLTSLHLSERCGTKGTTAFQKSIKNSANEESSSRSVQLPIYSPVMKS